MKLHDVQSKYELCSLPSESGLKKREREKALTPERGAGEMS
jgi:hypothetical protein